MFLFHSRRMRFVTVCISFPYMSRTFQAEKLCCASVSQQKLSSLRGFTVSPPRSLQIIMQRWLVNNIGLTSAASHMGSACYLCSMGKFIYEEKQGNTPLNLLSPAVFSSNCCSICLSPVCTRPTPRL